MSQKPQVMVVDDDLAMCGFLRSFLAARGYSALTVTNAEDAVRRFHAERPAAVLLDVVMPGSMDGLGALAAFKKIDRDVPIIVISGQGRTNTVVQAMKLGATDFVCKPFEDHELEVLIGTALRQRQLSQEVASLRAQLNEQSKHSMLFGHSETMAEVRDLIERVSDTDVTVMIRGESGTGKELVARALHERSLRKERPFVKVNCAALPTELLESELFGFEKGAFTGAIQQKPGKFEFANHGTMFLDEIGDIGYPLQAKLLQVLQDGEFSRLGGKSDVQVDVRLVAATNRDLETAVALGEFREDLYFRLNVVTINLPPLRERREEIPVLTDFFLKKYSVQYNKPVAGVNSELAQRLMNYDWPGNVRQLENMIKRMVVLGSEAAIVKELQQPVAPLPFRPRSPSSAPLPHRAGAQGGDAGPRPAPPGPAAPVMPPHPNAHPAAGPRESYARTAGTPGAAAGAVFSTSHAGATEAESMAAVTAAVAATAGAGTVSLKDIARTAAREAERELILRMLTRTRWNRKEAAEILGISYKALLYKIKENGLDKAS
jgi:two-component system response regulator AtoC